MRIDHANLARLDLNLLVAFDALIAEGHVTRAAERIGIGQSAMSHNLRRLRDLFGDELLIRSGGEMLPTPRALALAQAVGNVLSELQNTVLTAAVFDASRASRAFAVGISASLEIAIAPRLLAAIHADAPGIRLMVRSDSPEAMLRDLDAGALDVAIGAFADGGDHHIRRLLCEAEGYLCLFDERRTGLTSPISMDDFVRVPHLTVLSTDHAAQALDSSLTGLGVTRQVIYQTPHVQAVPFVLRETEAIAILCRRTALICAETFGLVTSPIPFDLPPQHVAAVWHSSHSRDPAHLWFRQKLFDIAAMLDSGATLSCAPADGGNRFLSLGEPAEV